MGRKSDVRTLQIYLPIGCKAKLLRLRVVPASFLSNVCGSLPLMQTLESNCRASTPRSTSRYPIPSEGHSEHLAMGQRKLASMRG